jgi:hypothetical protein
MVTTMINITIPLFVTGMSDVDIKVVQNNAHLMIFTSVERKITLLFLANLSTFYFGRLKTSAMVRQ